MPEAQVVAADDRETWTVAAAPSNSPAKETNVKTHARPPADAVRKGSTREAETRLRLDYAAPKIIELGEARELI